MIFFMALSVIATAIIGFIIYSGTEIEAAPNEINE